jgi:hypothetical protein
MIALLLYVRERDIQETGSTTPHSFREWLERRVTQEWTDPETSESSSAMDESITTAPEEIENPGEDPGETEKHAEDEEDQSGAVD